VKDGSKAARREPTPEISHRQARGGGGRLHEAVVVSETAYGNPIPRRHLWVAKLTVSKSGSSCDGSFCELVIGDRRHHTLQTLLCPCGELTDPGLVE